MISLLIPIRGEAVGAAAPFRACAGNFEIVVADGGERGPAASAFEELGARVLSLPGRNRGERLAASAGEARGEVLAFLHSDSLLPPGAASMIEQAVAGGASWGAFRLAYDDPGRIFGWIAAGANLRARALRMPFADQGIFCTRRAYAEAGGYPGLAVCDDLAFVRRLARVPGFRLLPAACVTSSRAYRGHPLRRVLRNWGVMIGYFLGIRVGTLERWYRADPAPGARRA